MKLMEYADFVVRKSTFEPNIYEMIYAREEIGWIEKYIDITTLTTFLNTKKVLILNKKDVVIFRNFKLMHEVI